MKILSDKQLWSLYNSNCRINIWEGAVRSGKTHASLLRWIRYILNAPQGNLLMLGKTYGTLVRNIINPMQEFIGKDMRFYSSMNKAEVWGRTIYCYGAGQKDAAGIIQGMTAAGCYGDELSLWPIEVFKMMLSRLSVEGAKFFGTTNPDAPKHPLKVEFIDKVGYLDVKTFHFALEDNIFLPKTYIEELKKEYVGLWYQRYILGLWAVAMGAIYDFYTDREPYVIKTPPPAEYYVVGIDYGTMNPAAFILFGVNKKTKPKIWAEKEYVYSGRDKQAQKTDSEYSSDLRGFLGNIKPRRIYPDPSARSFIVQLKKDKFLNVVEDVDNSVADGIRFQSSMLKNGDYAICSNCVKTREEYSMYIWDEKAQARGKDEPVKENDHTKDAERYTLYNEFGKKRYDMFELARL